jgi:hypothetical protein
VVAGSWICIECAGPSKSHVKKGQWAAVHTPYNFPTSPSELPLPEDAFVSHSWVLVHKVAVGEPLSDWLKHRSLGFALHLDYRIDKDNGVDVNKPSSDPTSFPILKHKSGMQCLTCVKCHDACLGQQPKWNDDILSCRDNLPETRPTSDILAQQPSLSLAARCRTGYDLRPLCRAEQCMPGTMWRVRAPYGWQPPMPMHRCVFQARGMPLESEGCGVQRGYGHRLHIRGCVQPHVPQHDSHAARGEAG